MPHDLDSLLVMETPESLVVASEEGRITRYKVQNGQLYYKASALAGWIQLSPEQTMQHLAINTVVGEWLRNRRHSAAVARPTRIATR